MNGLASSLVERRPVTSEQLHAARAFAVEELVALAGDHGWRPDRIPGMDWSSRQTVDHVCNTLAFYCNHAVLAARDHEPRIRSLGDASLTDKELARSVNAWVALLDLVLRSSEEDLLAWHPLGLTDVEGFLALACNELVVHTYDVARAHGTQLNLDQELCERLLRRLFPDVRIEADEAAAELLLWANGRLSTENRAQREGWRSHPAPLDL